MTNLTGKTAVITGATSGIGRGLARGFAQEGANLVPNGLGDADEIEATRAELGAAAAGSVRYAGANMTKPDQIEAPIVAVTAKPSVVGISKTIAAEVAEDGVSCSAIYPGYVAMPLVKAQTPDTAKSRGMIEEEVKRDVLLAAQRTKKFVTVAQLASVAVFLC